MKRISRIKFSSLCLLLFVNFSLHAFSFGGTYQESCKLYEDAKRKKIKDPKYQLGPFEKDALAMGIFYDFKEDGTYTKKLGQNRILQKAGLLEENKRLLETVREKGRWTYNEEASLITLKKGDRKTFIKVFEKKGDELDVRILDNEVTWKKLTLEKV